MNIPLPGFVFDPGAEHEAAEAWEKESGGRLYVRGTSTTPLSPSNATPRTGESASKAASA